MTHASLVILATRWLKAKDCRVVLAEPRCASCGESPDAIGWLLDGRSIVVEAKRTRKDFLAEWSRKDRKHHRRHEGVGVQRYYLAPASTIRVDELTNNGWGLIEAWPRALVIRAESANFNPDLQSELKLIASSFSRVKRVEDRKQQQFNF